MSWMRLHRSIVRITQLDTCFSESLATERHSICVALGGCRAKGSRAQRHSSCALVETCLRRHGRRRAIAASPTPSSPAAQQNHYIRTLLYSAFPYPGSPRRGSSYSKGGETKRGGGGWRNCTRHFYHPRVHQNAEVMQLHSPQKPRQSLQSMRRSAGPSNVKRLRAPGDTY